MKKIGKWIVNSIIFIFPGPKKISLIKSYIILPLLFISLLGIFSHLLSLRGKEELGERFRAWPSRLIFEEISVNLFVGILTFYFLDIAFHNVEKWFGKKSRFDYNDLANDIAEIKKGEDIKILSIFLRVFTPPKKENGESHDEFNMRLMKFESTLENFKDSLLKAIKDKKTKIEILLLDPITFSARHRKKEIKEAALEAERQNKYYEDIDVIDEIVRTINNLTEIYLSNNIVKNYVEIKLYDRLPPFSLFKVQDQYSFSFYSSEKTIRDTEHWIFYEGTAFQRFVIGTFNEIWIDKNRTYALEEYLYTNLFLDITYSTPLCGKCLYVDIYNEENSFVPENKIIAIFPLKKHCNDIRQQQERGEVYLKYRNKKAMAKFIDIDLVPMKIKLGQDYSSIDYIILLLTKKYPMNTSGVLDILSNKNKEAFFIELIDLNSLK